ncbi:hypothetical protein FGM00_12960 [Aggregatimonas sangjinii]|uniref:Lipoprotein n=1 Tax=Aggregatimonas sangjinii TaxID=2583587 RepID=A0A5B7SQY3_9FLAO|nr:hypothetical protein [Aggregatimonas sangjinii]QCX00977.1 hypothetical protein FGM00_12960 [Aggregatimonas sangjinii]
MKKISIMLVITCFLVSCNKEDVNQDVPAENLEFADPLSNMVEDLSSVSARSTTNSASNPVVITAETFVDFVDYTIPICDIGPFKLERFNGLFYGLPNGTTSSAPTIWDLTDEGCYARVSSSGGSGQEEFQFGLYYEIFGIVVQKSEPLNRTRGFWFTEIDNSDQVRKVTFFEDGSFELGLPMANPIQTDLNCSGAGTFPTGNFFASDFPRGERLVRNLNDQNLLYESLGNGLRFLGICGEGEIVTDICADVEPFNRSTRYRRGDQVVYRNFLFTRVRRGWRRDGRCGIN